MGMMTSEPSAKIGDVLQVPFQHLCDRQELRSSKDDFEWRNHTLDLLARPINTLQIDYKL